MKDIGKPCAGKPHAGFDEGGLVKATKASSLLYPFLFPLNERVWFDPQGRHVNLIKN